MPYRLPSSQLTLLRLSHKQVRDKRSADRIKAVYLWGVGDSFPEIARVLLLDETTLKRYVRRYRVAALMGEVELSTGDRVTLKRARKIKNFMSQNFFVAGNQRGVPGVFMPIEVTVRDVRAILAGAYDDIPEQDFLFIGSAEDVRQKR